MGSTVLVFGYRKCNLILKGKKINIKEFSRITNTGEVCYIAGSMSRPANFDKTTEMTIES